MTHWTRIFAELSCTKRLYILNTLHGIRSHVTTELLISEYCQSFLQCELEPIPTCHTISCPIVEVFMSNYTFDKF